MRTNEKNKRPAYVSVAEKIEKRIYEGLYRPGSKLPAIRVLADKFSSSRKVVTQALDLLSTRDLVYSVPKSGVFVNPEIQTGIYRRIGFYIEQANPINAGSTITAVFNTTAKHSFSAVLGYSDFDQMDGFTTFLKKYPHIDGVLFTGMVDEKLLSEVVRKRIPYVVLGNYNIASYHHQICVDVAQLVYDALIESFSMFKGKKIACLMGNDDYAADAESVKGVKRAIADAGADTNENLVVSCKTGDGLIECTELLEKYSPDALFIMGGHIIGYRKYLKLHLSAKKPFVIYNSNNPTSNATPSIIDKYVSCGLCSPDRAVVATEALIQKIMSPKIKE